MLLGSNLVVVLSLFLGEISMTLLSNRHDIYILFDVRDGNPNGDPDAGNMPRVDPTSNCGLISDVCLKRKIRNFVLAFPPVAEAQGYDIFVRQGAILNSLIDKAEPEANKVSDVKKNRDDWEKAALDWLCNCYYDLRAFGAVLSTKNKVFKGSSYGQVRGPIQFTFARSFHPITLLEISITRCAATNEKEKMAEESDDAGSGGNRTMGNKHIVPYALYLAKAYISPVFAEKTGFTQRDMELFFEALKHMFTHDHSASRGDMNVRAIYDFEHVGTQPAENAEQNKREAKLGCAHAHRLFDGIKVALRDGMELPTCFEDYSISDAWSDKAANECILPGVKLNRILGPSA